MLFICWSAGEFPPSLEWKLVAGSCDGGERSSASDVLLEKGCLKVKNICLTPQTFLLIRSGSWWVLCLAQGHLDCWGSNRLPDSHCTSEPCWPYKPDTFVRKMVAVMPVTLICVQVLIFRCVSIGLMLWKGEVTSWLTAHLSQCTQRGTNGPVFGIHCIKGRRQEM